MKNKIFNFSKRLTHKLLLFSISLLLVLTSSGLAYEFDIKNTDFFTIEQICDHNNDGSKKDPFILLIEQRSVNDLPQAELSSKTREILKARRITYIESEIVVGGKKVHIRTTMYLYQPTSLPITLTPKSFDYLPKYFYPFGEKEVIDGIQNEGS